MSLSLPADIEPFLRDGYEWSDAGCYALNVDVPSDVRERFESEFDVIPGYVHMLEERDAAMYVGASANVLRRLEDHRDGEKRKAVLFRVCEIDSVEGVWWFDSKDKAFEEEYNIGSALQTLNPTVYVHQR